jgi:hypothetical protein
LHGSLPVARLRARLDVQRADAILDALYGDRADES